MNKGIDIQAPYGTPVKAVQDGEVSFAAEEVKGYGKLIIVDHPGGLQTVYAHNSENLVMTGQTVKKDQIIAKVGSSGASSGLHFQIRRNHRPIDPLQCLT